MRLGQQQEFVLAYCLANDGEAEVKTLVRRYRGWPTRSGTVEGLGGGKSAQASMARTLRALWRKRLVELWDAYGESATGRLQLARLRASWAEQDPQSYYEGYFYGSTEPPGSTPEELRAEVKEDAQRQETHPAIRVTRVTLLEAGQRVAEGLPAWQELTKA